ncbi:hypothetical protein LFL96_36765 (plasmid) [Paraburkholderia sp. D15]|uniref:hypothetical protein n=1 Tax=Paraburkholderia sp. D15 TaxID=2880218 RepID=UPI00247A667B|nr:hypothetical protein [Paraburkholderia sp. D15]WGS55031.1 hypothetical protein LFL96_36765 [Paraburkholderia sp. D15]
MEGTKSAHSLKYGWASLWRAHVALPRDIAPDEFTIFVRATNSARAGAAMEDVLKAMYPDAHRVDLADACYNMKSARELVEQGVSRSENDRLFEVAWQGNRVVGWVTKPVFVVVDSPELFEAWATARNGNHAA